MMEWINIDIQYAPLNKWILVLDDHFCIYPAIYYEYGESRITVNGENHCPGSIIGWSEIPVFNKTDFNDFNLDFKEAEWLKE